MSQSEDFTSEIVYMSQIKYKTIDRIFIEKGHSEDVFMQFDQVYSTKIKREVSNKNTLYQVQIYLSPKMMDITRKTRDIFDVLS